MRECLRHSCDVGNLMPLREKIFLQLSIKKSMDSHSLANVGPCCALAVSFNPRNYLIDVTSLWSFFIDNTSSKGYEVIMLDQTSWLKKKKI